MLIFVGLLIYKLYETLKNMSKYTKGSIEWYKDMSKEIGSAMEQIFLAEHDIAITKMQQMSKSKRLEYIAEKDLPMDILQYVADKEFSVYNNGRIPLKDWIKYNKV